MLSILKITKPLIIFCLVGEIDPADSPISPQKCVNVHRTPGPELGIYIHNKRSSRIYMRAYRSFFSSYYDVGHGRYQQKSDPVFKTNGAMGNKQSKMLFPRSLIIYVHTVSKQF